MCSLDLTERYGHQKDLWDLFSIKETAEGKGIAKGIEIGREKGRKEGLKEGLEKGERKGIVKIAQSMKQQGFPIDQIAQVTELTKEEINAL